MLIAFIAMAAASASPQVLSAGKIDDLRCFESTAWALSWMGEENGDGAVTKVRLLSYYYLGRLSADNSVDWLAYARLDMSEHRRSEKIRSDDLSRCSDRFATLTRSSVK